MPVGVCVCVPSLFVAWTTEGTVPRRQIGGSIPTHVWDVSRETSDHPGCGRPPNAGESIRSGCGETSGGTPVGVRGGG